MCVYIYRKYGLKYTTPTIGTFLYPEDYLVFLENFSKVIKQPLEFKKSSKYSDLNLNHKIHPYPIGILDSNI